MKTQSKCWILSTKNTNAKPNKKEWGTNVNHFTNRLGWSVYSEKCRYIHYLVSPQQESWCIILCIQFEESIWDSKRTKRNGWTVQISIIRPPIRWLLFFFYTYAASMIDQIILFRSFNAALLLNWMIERELRDVHENHFFLFNRTNGIELQWNRHS